MSNLETLMRVHARAAHHDFYRDGHLWSPLWLIENKEGQRLLLATPMDKDASREAYAEMVRKAIKQFRGVRYAYAMETWYLQIEEGQPMVRPSTSPNRKEGILIAGEDIDGEQRVVRYEIKRHGDRKPTLGKAEFDQEFSGTFADMFSVGPYL